jgi:hypothetical protein
MMSCTERTRAFNAGLNLTQNKEYVGLQPHSDDVDVNVERIIKEGNAHLSHLSHLSRVRGAWNTIKNEKVEGARIVCLDCGTSSTPQWRMGPTGA